LLCSQLQIFRCAAQFERLVQFQRFSRALIVNGFVRNYIAARPTVNLSGFVHDSKKFRCGPTFNLSGFVRDSKG
jgi:hypothetical protein